MRSLQARWAQLAAEIDRAAETDLAFGMHTGNWLAWATSAPAHDARRRVRVSRIFDHFVGFSDALSTAAISWEHCVALDNVCNWRNRDNLVAVEDELLSLADALSFEDWQQQLIAIARMADPDGTDPDSSDESLSARIVGDQVAVSGQLNATNGALFRAALNRLADEIFRQHRHDHSITGVPIPDRGALRAAALMELVRRANATDPENAVPAKPEALIVLEPDDDGWSAATIDGDELPTAPAVALLSDALVSFARRDTLGNIIAMSAPRRLVTQRLRRLLNLRDGGCVFPGCSASVDWCDAHHVTHWIHGGKSVPENLALLCRHHHGVVHRNGWEMTIDATQHVHFITPGGRQFEGERRTPHERRLQRNAHRNLFRQPDPPAAEGTQLAS